jgi:hypothetical protein
VSHLGCRRHCMRSGSLGSNQCQGRKVLPKQIRAKVSPHIARARSNRSVWNAPAPPLSAKDGTFDIGNALAYCHCTVMPDLPKLHQVKDDP